jgi:hypothetical protein
MLSPELLSREILSWKWLRAAEETLEREMGQGKMQIKKIYKARYKRGDFNKNPEYTP